MDQQSNLAPLRQLYAKYTQQLLFDLGLSDLEQPLRGRLINALDQYLSQAMTHIILENLDDAAAEGITEQLEKDKPQDEVIAYLIASIPNIQAKLDEGMDKAYDRILEESRQLTAAIAQQRQQTNQPPASS